MLSFLAAPLAASLVIAGIHAYLGVHVVERGVIFVDLSLAQIAAFGATIALIMPWSDGDPHGNMVYWTSLAFTILGAAIFAGFTLYIVTVSLVAMTSSAYVKWRVVAGALVLAFFFLLAGAAEMVNSVFRVEWASTFNPGYALGAVWSEMLDIEIPDDKPGAFECAVFLIALSGGLLALLARKLRAVEVVK